LRDFVQQTLPGYMVPASITTLASLPRLSNGKVDRMRLNVMATTPAVGRRTAKPQNSTERKLAALLNEVVAVEDIGLEDDFFTIGGTSLLAMRYLARIG